MTTKALWKERFFYHTATMNIRLMDQTTITMYIYVFHCKNIRLVEQKPSGA